MAFRVGAAVRGLAASASTTHMEGHHNEPLDRSIMLVWIVASQRLDPVRQKMVSTARPQQKPASGRIKAAWKTVGLSPVPSARAFVFRLRVRVGLCRLLDLRCVLQ
jgi:hypothetical protein